MSEDAKLCWLAAFIALAVWCAVIGGMVWQWREAQTLQVRNGIAR